MVQFEEEDLFYDDYINTIGEYPDYIAIEGLKTFDLREKFHVIFICDAYLKRYRLDKDVANFQKAERIIKSYKLSFSNNINELFSYVLQMWALAQEPTTEPAF